MSKLRDKINFFLYVLALIVAILVVYQAFSTGLKKGRFAGKYYPPEDKSAQMGEEIKPVNLRLLRIATPELVVEGKKLYKLNCASCHGDAGHGDGPKSVSLVPPPRNFSSEKFKNGSSVLQIYNTLATGIQGTSMPAFDLLPEEDRIAMAHYVQTFVPDPPEDPQELVDALPVVEGDEVVVSDSSAAAAGDSAKPAVKAIPIEDAMKLYLAENQTRPAAVSGEARNALFDNYCSSCHGTQGEGVVSTEQIVPEAVIYMKSGVLRGRQLRSLSDYNAFKRFMISGSPGLEKHRFGFLSDSQVQELYRFIRKLSE